jgi:glycosyltransferase involved in cell wall biosynthesis
LLNNLSATLNLIKPDIVICHNPYLLISYQIAQLKQKYNFKLIYDTHAAAFNTKLTDTLLKQLYLRWFIRIAVPKVKSAADSFFAIGESECNMLEKTFHFPQKSVPIIRLGVDTERFKFSKKNRREIRQKLKIKATEYLLIYAGKITPNKKVEVLIQALSNITSKYKLLLIGGGEAAYVKLITSAISETGQLIKMDLVNNKELHKYFSAADIGVWPGDPSLSMLEAIATGLPLVTSKSSETDYLASIDSVFRVQQGDVTGLAKSILIIPKITEKARIDRQNELKKLFSWQNKAKQVLNLLKS